MMKNRWAKIDLAIGDADGDGLADVWLAVDFHGIQIEHRFELDFLAAVGMVQETVRGILAGAPKKAPRR